MLPSHKPDERLKDKISVGHMSSSQHHKELCCQKGKGFV